MSVALFEEDIDVEKTDNGDMWTSPDKNMEPRNPTEEPKPADEPKLISEPTDEPTVVVKGQNGPESYEPGPDSTPVALEKLSYQFCELCTANVCVCVCVHV